MLSYIHKSLILQYQKTIISSTSIDGNGAYGKNQNCACRRPCVSARRHKGHIGSAAHFQVIAEAGDGEEAINLVSELCPDMVIMDIELPKINGIEATKIIKASNPEISILVLTAYDNDQYIFALLEAGLLVTC